MVSALGFGAMQAGDPALPENEARALLHGALDLGIRLIDTARSYGLSEERIGRYLQRRRDEFVLSTKVGYDVPGHADWTPRCVLAGVEAARRRLASDVIDIVYLHSCDDTILQGGVVDALAECVQRGWVRVAGYSGDGAALDLAAADTRLGALQASFNCVDQAAAATITRAAAQGRGVLAKRPYFGLPWLQPACPADPPHAEYWRRFQQVAPRLGNREWSELALRFAAHAPGVAACLVGGTSLAHLARNVAACAAGPLDADAVAAVRGAFAEFGGAWRGVI
jgi:aryl-alcohol dehydrogenase-like predicted oxidoreductase